MLKNSMDRNDELCDQNWLKNKKRFCICQLTRTVELFEVTEVSEICIYITDCQCMVSKRELYATDFIIQICRNLM
jgi:hypothetical protein